jgi:hypothetical protein
MILHFSPKIAHLPVGWVGYRLAWRGKARGHPVVERREPVRNEWSGRRSNLSVRDLGLTTDEAGRFRLTRLRQGRYIIQVKAAGFKDRELEPIPAGTSDVVVTLARSP